MPAPYFKLPGILTTLGIRKPIAENPHPITNPIVCPREEEWDYCEDY